MEPRRDGTRPRLETILRLTAFAAGLPAEKRARLARLGSRRPLPHRRAGLLRGRPGRRLLGRAIQITEATRIGEVATGQRYPPA